MDNQKIKNAVAVTTLYMKMSEAFYEVQEGSGAKFTKGRKKFREDLKDALNILITIANSVTVTKVRELPGFPQKEEHSKDCKYLVRHHSHDCDCGAEDFNAGINICGDLTIVREKLIPLDVGEIIKQMGKELIFGHISYNGLENIAKYISSKFGVRLKEGA